MPAGHSVASLRQYTAAAQVSPVLRRQLVDCWVAVTNAGGAVGFPFPPVDEATVAPAADDLIARLDPDLRRLLVAVRNDRLAGWVSIHREANPLITHWGNDQPPAGRPGIPRPGHRQRADGQGKAGGARRDAPGSAPSRGARRDGPGGVLSEARLDNRGPLAPGLAIRTQ